MALSLNVHWELKHSDWCINPVLIFPRFSLDTHVRDILGDWFYMQDGYRSNQLKLRDALGHRSGLARHDVSRLYHYGLQEHMRYIRKIVCMCMYIYVFIAGTCSCNYCYCMISALISVHVFEHLYC